ncbi:unnamed protein product [Arabidopsis arenosa]|uniref:Uncharacterized protein n=1 Tax=Arabidopsis arenosa TaxID=38785 RepID=A0A8S2AFF9_ARAAE|nr:unnamed protein product [Arabidopsis arenosa]
MTSLQTTILVLGEGGSGAVYKGGLSSGYKNRMTEKGSSDETDTMESVALIQISGTGVHNNKALQVEVVGDNKLIYQDNPRLKTALEMLRTSMNLEDTLHEVPSVLQRDNVFVIRWQKAETVQVEVKALKLYIIKITSTNTRINNLGITKRVTRLAKEGTGKTTLEIGDGENDVGMIQEADIGVGIRVALKLCKCLRKVFFSRMVKISNNYKIREMEFWLVSCCGFQITHFTWSLGSGSKKYRYFKDLNILEMDAVDKLSSCPFLVMLFGFPSELMSKGKHFILIRNPLHILPSSAKVVNIDERVIADGKVGLVTRTLQNASLQEKAEDSGVPIHTNQEP